MSARPRPEHLVPTSSHCVPAYGRSLPRPDRVTLSVAPADGDHDLERAPDPSDEADHAVPRPCAGPTSVGFGVVSAQGVTEEQETRALKCGTGPRPLAR